MPHGAMCSLLGAEEMIKAKEYVAAVVAVASDQSSLCSLRHRYATEVTKVVPSNSASLVVTTSAT